MSLIDHNDPKVARIHALPLFRDADKKALGHLASAVVDGEVVAEIPVGEMIGELGMFIRGPASATVRAKTDMTVLVLPHNRVDQSLQENPTAVLGVAKEPAARLRAMDANQH